MKKAICAAALSCLSLTAYSREVNLINNSAFSNGELHWHYEGKGNCKVEKGIAAFRNGKISHYFDLGNLEHADPQCAMPANRVFRFRVKARGNGEISLTVRARKMLAGNAVELTEYKSGIYKLTGKFQNFDFELQEPDRFTVFHDKLSICVNGDVEVDDTSFYYLDRNAFSIVFKPECAVVRHGETVTVDIVTDRPEQKLTVDLYCGQTLLAGYTPPERKEIITDKNGIYKYTFKVSNAASDGMRMAVSDPETGVKNSFFATIVPEEKLQKYAAYSKQLTGKKHLLFLGDSLSDYDRGRNYPSIVGAYLPEKWSFRNAGVGGDTLGKIYTRLTGGKINRPEMYKDLFKVMPDMIFIFIGGNDCKVSFASGYKDTHTPRNQQRKLMDDIIAELKKCAPEADIVFISPLDSFLPYQLALAEPKVAKKANHNLFGHPEPTADLTGKMKQAAQDHRAYFINAGEVFRTSADPQSLNVPDDGVHLSLKGHQLMAEIVLKFLTGIK